MDFNDIKVVLKNCKKCLTDGLMSDKEMKLKISKELNRKILIFQKTNCVLDFECIKTQFIEMNDN
jgi:hypothetical protein